jgi:arylsulfatase A-like enzyme
VYYYGLCTQIDYWVGEIVRTLEETGRAADTWIVFNSDHGEMLGDHGLYSKRTFYRTSVQVPMVIAPPRAGGVSVDGLVQNFDLPATLLDIAGAESDFQHGRSLAGVFEGRDVTRESVVSEIAGFLMVSDGRHKLVLTRDTLESQCLYDLEADPDERTDVLAHQSDAAGDLIDRYAKPFASGAR